VAIPRTLLVVMLGFPLAWSVGPPALAYEAAPVLDGGTLAGVVRYVGPPPSPERVTVTKDVPVCGQEKSLQVVRLGDAGGLRDVAVVVRATRGKPLVVPSEPVVFDQRGCEYRPFVLAFPAGSTIQVLNSDRVLHNVHVMGKANPQTNRAMPRFQKQLAWRVERPEWPIPVKCDVHPWMRAYWLAMDHPYYAVTEASGRFRIDDLVPGDYAVDLWHPALGSKVEQVTIRSRETTTVSWSFAAP